MEIDVALVPAEARRDGPAVRIVIDEIRASTTITTLFDLGCSELIVSGAVATAKRIARERGSLLVGERHALKPPGFDFDNSPVRLVRAGAMVADRSVVLCTTNGTAVLRRLRGSDGHVLVGCIRNARACAEAAIRLALEVGTGIQVVCAGQQGRFNIDDTVAAGVIVGRLADAVRAHGGEPDLTDGATAAVRLRESYPDLFTALDVSEGGRTLRRIGQGDDIRFCAEEDASMIVATLLDGSPTRLERLRL